MDVPTATQSSVLVMKNRVGRKDELPNEVFARVRHPLRICPRHDAGTVPACQIRDMQLFYLEQMPLQRHHQLLRKQGETILPPFSITHQDASVREINVLYSNTVGFRDPHA